MEFIPIYLIIFKVLVLGLGMFFAVKWHYDQDKKSGRGKVMTVVTRTAAVFGLLLACLLIATFKLAGLVGLDVSFPG